MLKSVDVKFTETGTLTIAAKGITVFVGPNNSGKSLVLREIETSISEQKLPAGLRIVTDFEIEWPELSTVSAGVERARLSTPAEVGRDHVHLGRFTPGRGKEAQEIYVPSLLNIASQKSDKGWMASNFIRWGLIRLDGRSRFTLTDDQKGGDLIGPPQNVLAQLFQDDLARASVRAIVKDAFNVNLYIDPTNSGNLRLRISSREIPGDEQSLNKEAREFYKNATHIKEASDGVQAFTGIVTAVLSGEYHTILIDEPEAFLHPPLARKLGKNLATIAAQRNGTLMASTHSADFLMGCVQSRLPVQVVRLEYGEGKSRAKSIDSASLEAFFKKPLMRSTNVISGLFHDGVVVLESDNDRAFYSEIYHRLAEGRADYPSLLFVNAQNKQTIRDIIGPLREFGVPAAAIPDIDIVKDGGKTWTDWLTAAQFPVALHVGLGQQRAAVEGALRSSGRNMKTGGGVNILSSQDKAAADFLFGNLEAFGIFTVRIGEVENWLSDLNVPGKKTDWAVAMLERLGSDTTHPGYVWPAADDVWAFLDRIVAWIRNPARSGTA